MNNIYNFLKRYLVVITILITVSIVLSMSYSNFLVTSENHKVAEMYIGTLKYSMTIGSTADNKITLPPPSIASEIIIDINVVNENPIDTYYKLIYENNSNVTIKYYQAYELDDSNNISKTYNKPNDKITSNNTNTVKLKLINNGTSTQNIVFKIVGGFATNTLDDITVPSDYTIIDTVENTNTNIYFCRASSITSSGDEYVNGQYTYAYEREGKSTSSTANEWNYAYHGDWGVQLTDKTSTDAVTSKMCTYVNNYPITSMSFIFGNSKATEIDLSSFDTSNTINMSNMFSNSLATTLDISNFDTSKVTNMSGMFNGSRATSLDISNFDTSKVTNMNNMFKYSRATSLDLSNFDTSNVTNMSSMFEYSQAKTLDISNFNTLKVTDMNRMFYDSQATTLDLSSFDTSNVTNMSEMFFENQATTLNISSFNTSKVTDMNSMFCNSQATSLNVSNFDTSNVTNMAGMFALSQAATIDLSNFDTSNVTNMSGMFSGSQATDLNLSNFNTSKVTIMASMFNCAKVTTLDLSSFDTSNVTYMGDMFNGIQVTDLDLSNFDTSNVTNMKSMFSFIETETLNLSNFNTTNVTDMSSMFSYSQVTALDLSSFDTSNVTNMSSMFEYSQATTIDLSSFDTSKVTDMSEMFMSSSNLKTIYASNNFVTNNVSNSSNMFAYCTNLVGGAGTKYNYSYRDKAYAHIDGGTSNPGYFTSVPEPNSFSTDSWKIIANAVKNGNTGKYNIGDTKTIDMGTYGTHTLRIANTSTPSECSTSGFSQSACGFVLEFADVITTHNMNPDGTYKGTMYGNGWNVDGWPASEMYTFVNANIYNSLPSDLKNIIVDTVTISGHGKTSGETNFTSTDKLYLLSPKEIYTDFSENWDTAKDLTRTLDYYTIQGVTTSSNSGTIKRNGTSIVSWWLRTAYSYRNNTFYLIHTNGSLDNYSSSYTLGVSPAFRIG